MFITRKISIIALLLVLLLGGAGGGALADDGVPPSTSDEALLALINQARQNPLEVAASLGLDPAKILADLPELEVILQEGLPPLTFNENLVESAGAHTGDMFVQGYYSDISPDGRGHEERIGETGYPAAISGESLGMILFANFISPDDAVRLIFEYMFQDELDPSRTEKRNILDPCLRETGISVQSGRLKLGGVRWNVYLATGDFGAVISCPEAEMLELINQARENPLQTAASLGMDPEQILADFPGQHDLLTQGLPPLTFNISLAQAARAHGADMAAGGYYSHDSADGRTYKDRLQEAGYDPLVAGESLGNIPWSDGLDEQTAVGELFEYMFKSELAENFPPEQWNILNSEFTEAGIGVVRGQVPGLGGICGDEVELAVADFGASQEVADPADPDAVGE